MGVSHEYVFPYNPAFDLEAYYAYRSNIEAYQNFIWTSTVLDHMRLPANSNIFDFLIYVGQLLEDWLPSVGYSGENILYSPAFPDIIYSLHGSTSQTQDSPHKKVPPVISYKVVRREPDSQSVSPFGSRKKMWKFRNCGEFQADNGEIYRVRYRSWETAVEFSCVHRSGAEAEALCIGFEQFMDMNESKFQEAGLDKMAPLGRREEPDMKLEEAGVHYRSTRFWFRTQEFQFAGPISTMDDIELDIAVQE